MMFVFIVAFLLLKISTSSKVLDISKSSVYFRNIISKYAFSIPDTNRAIQTLDALNQKNEIVTNLISRCERAKIPISFSLLDTPSFCMFMNSIPRRSSIPLHTRPGKVFLYILTGSLGVNQAIMTDTVLMDNKNDAYISHEDAFAESAGDDCVCRGGICPRRNGCIFWVEKQLRNQKGYMIGKMNNCIVDSKLAPYCTFEDANIIQPREFTNKQDEATVFVELLIKEDDFNSSLKPNLIQYYRINSADNSGVHLYSCEFPLGEALTTIGYNL